MSDIHTNKHSNIFSEIACHHFFLMVYYLCKNYSAEIFTKKNTLLAVAYFLTLGSNLTTKIKFIKYLKEIFGELKVNKSIPTIMVS